MGNNKGTQGHQVNQGMKYLCSRPGWICSCPSHGATDSGAYLSILGGAVVRGDVVGGRVDLGLELGVYVVGGVVVAAGVLVMAYMGIRCRQSA